MMRTGIRARVVAIALALVPLAALTACTGGTSSGQGCGSMEAATATHFDDLGVTIPEGGCVWEVAVYYFSADSDFCSEFGAALLPSLDGFETADEPVSAATVESGTFNAFNEDRVAVYSECARAGVNFWSDLGITVAETDIVATLRVTEP